MVFFHLVIKDVAAAVADDTAYIKKTLDNPFWIRKSKRRDRKKVFINFGCCNWRNTWNWIRVWVQSLNQVKPENRRQIILNIDPCCLQWFMNVFVTLSRNEICLFVLLILVPIVNISKWLTSVIPRTPNSRNCGTQWT